MEYQCYRNKEQIFRYIEECFPFVQKSTDDELLIYREGDPIGRYIKEHMAVYKDPRLPIEGVRYLHDELRELSENGMAWLLPSLLRCAVRAERYDSIPEFLVYDLESEFDGNDGVKRRYSLLNKEQVVCLCAVLEFFSEEFELMVGSAQVNLDGMDEVQ